VLMVKSFLILVNVKPGFCGGGRYLLARDRIDFDDCLSLVARKTATERTRRTATLDRTVAHLLGKRTDLRLHQADKVIVTHAYGIMVRPGIEDNCLIGS
jgi:hypothetical protein